MDIAIKTPWIRKVFLLDNVREFDEHTFKRLQFINLLSYIGITTLTVFIIALNTTTEAVISSAVTIVAFFCINIMARYGTRPPERPSGCIAG